MRASYARGGGSVQRLCSGRVEPSLAHLFLRRLETEGKLLRCYTQNIDTLESVAGVERVVSCHGSFATATCTKCGHSVAGETIEAVVRRGHIPLCRQPDTRRREATSGTSGGAGDTSRPRRSARSRTPSYVNHARAAATGAVSHPSQRPCVCACRQRGVATHTGEYEPDVPDTACRGVMKPDITFFGEALDRSVARSLRADRRAADLLLVMGTSMKVSPMSTVPKLLKRSVPQVLINMQHVPLKRSVSEGFDVELLGRADDVVQCLSHRLGWGLPVPTDDPRVGGSRPLTPHQAHGAPRVYLFDGAEWHDDAYATASAGACSDAMERLPAGSLVCDACGSVAAGYFYKCRSCLWFEVCHACFTASPCGVAGQQRVAKRGVAKPRTRAKQAAWVAEHRHHKFVQGWVEAAMSPSDAKGK